MASAVPRLASALAGAARRERMIIGGAGTDRATGGTGPMAA